MVEWLVEVELYDRKPPRKKGCIEAPSSSEWAMGLQLLTVREKGQLWRLDLFQIWNFQIQVLRKPVGSISYLDNKHRSNCRGALPVASMMVILHLRSSSHMSSAAYPDNLEPGRKLTLPEESSLLESWVQK